MTTRSDNLENRLLDTACKMEELIQQDPGNRGLAKWAVKDHFLPATRSLLNAGHVILTTGFFIKNAGVIETDGPPGALLQVKALEGLGKKVTIITDDHAADIMRKGLDFLGCDAVLTAFGADEDIPADEFIMEDTTHFITIERPGRAADGKYYNFRGLDISPWVAPVDDVLLACHRRNITTIAIGDGGNELGTAQVSCNVDRHIAPDRPFSCKIFADYCICAGVSNWAGYAQAALLSYLSGKNLMLDPAGLAGLLDEIVTAGAVDGVSGKQEATVDGLDKSWEHEIYAKLYAIAANGG